MKFAYLLASSAASGVAHHVHGVHDHSHEQSEPVCSLRRPPVHTGDAPVFGIGPDTPPATFLTTSFGSLHDVLYQDQHVLGGETLGGDFACHNGTACHGPRTHVWIHASPCVRDPSKGEEHCAFVHPTFANGRGIALLTTPNRAAFLADQPIFRRTNVDVLKTGPPQYEVREVPGKGFGLVATEFIPRGELVLVDRASFLVDYKAVNALSVEQVKELQADAVNMLPAPHRATIVGLSTQFETNLSFASTVDRVLATNAFDIAAHTADPDQQPAFFALFPEMARMNHDCRSNTDHFFDYDTMAQYVHAVRDIAPGEEITLSYISPLQEKAARLHRLHETWGFQCSCSLCAAEPAVAEASDARIRQINEMLKEFASYLPESGASPQLAEKAIRLYEQERLWSSMHEIYTLASVEYNGAGDVWSAVKYARLALEHGKAVVGIHSTDMQQMAMLADNPWSHWSWMLRTTTKMGPMVAEGANDGRAEDRVETDEDSTWA